jgi:hypothetical protein
VLRESLVWPLLSRVNTGGTSDYRRMRNVHSVRDELLQAQETSPPFL